MDLCFMVFCAKSVFAEQSGAGDPSQAQDDDALCALSSIYFQDPVISQQMGFFHGRRPSFFVWPGQNCS
ncbi:hypothetical protein IAD21_04793 [Abditibacteriota bacterium]|nr:hypothetical protein IAD21_04793 [Abditibacteriota bacterium]